MHILNLIQCAEIGGTEQGSLRLMTGLKERGHSFELVSLNPIGLMGPLLEKNDIPAKGFAYRGMGGYKTALQVRNYLRTVRAEAMIMTGHHFACMLFGLGGFCRGKRILSINFHHKGVKPRFVWRMIYAVAVSRFQAIIFPTDFVRLEAESIFPGIKPLTRTINYSLSIPPLPSEKDKESARKALDLPIDAPVVGNAGQLIPRKRFDIFLRTAQKVRKFIPQSIFLIAGGGVEYDRLRGLANELGMNNSVRWLGWQKDLSNFYYSLDVLLFNSDWDAFGLTSAEAMARCVPVVASVLYGGLQEAISDTKYGYLLNTHDKAKLAEIIISLLQNKQLALSVGKAGRERIADVGSEKRCIDNYEKVLESCSR